MKAIVLLVCAFVAVSRGLENGLARTPPMGWLSWERFRCNTDCTNDPDNCISEKLFMQMADRFVSDGYKDAGYEYVNIDDCWLAKERDPKTKRLVADPERFPSGMKALADYMHQRGLKLGIYEDFGTHTCGGFPGSEYFLQLDAQTFADWGVDYLKLDGCYSEPKQYNDAYPAMTMWLNMTGRPMVYSCSWPAYEQSQAEYPRIAENCNLWRNYADIQDSWASLSDIINHFGDDATHFVDIAKPGAWNDPDMLLIGNFGLSQNQERAQMALWSIMASPLIMSTDLRNLRPDARALLLNRMAISINQDPMGKQGKRISSQGSIQIWTRPLSGGSFAFAFLNTGTGGTPTKVSMTVKDLGFSATAGYNITEVFDGKNMGAFKPSDTFSAYVNPTGVFFAKAQVMSTEKNTNLKFKTLIDRFKSDKWQVYN